MDNAAQERRFYEAKRAAVKLRLVRNGMTEGHAERWLWAWEGAWEGAMPFELYSTTFWDRGLRWIEAAAQAGKGPLRSAIGSPTESAVRTLRPLGTMERR